MNSGPRAHAGLPINEQFNSGLPVKKNGSESTGDRGSVSLKPEGLMSFQVVVQNFRGSLENDRLVETYFKNGKLLPLEN